MPRRKKKKNELAIEKYVKFSFACRFRSVIVWALLGWIPLRQHNSNGMSKTQEALPGTRAPVKWLSREPRPHSLSTMKPVSAF